MLPRAAVTVCHCCLLLAALSAAATAANVTCGSQNPDKVDNIPAANVASSSVSSITVIWRPPGLDFDKPFYYTLMLECTGCETRTVNNTESPHVFSNLTAATFYNVSIRAGLADCQLSDAIRFDGKTHLTPLQGSVNFDEVTETSLRASWTPSPDVGVMYEVSACGQVTSAPNVTCPGLQSGSVITVTVRATKSGFQPSQSISGTALTKLFAVSASSARYSATATAITVSWNASVTAGVLYELTCSGAGGDRTMETQNTTATCDSLEPGQLYELIVRVKKVGGFLDAVTNLDTKLTKPSLSTEPSDFSTFVNITEGEGSSAAVLVTVAWLASAAKGADTMLIRVTSQLNPDLVFNSSVPFANGTFEVNDSRLFSEELLVTLSVLAEKSGLTEQSEESFIRTVLIPPNRPSVTLTPEKRFISVTLTSTSKSEYLRVAENETSQTCSPEPQGSCSITLLPLKPFTVYTVEAWAQNNDLNSSKAQGSARTLEDAPSLPMSLTVTVKSPSEAGVEWQQPTEPNGIITNYTVHYGMLDFLSGTEQSGQSESIRNETHMELQTLSAGQEYYWYVSACTAGGCSNRSERATALQNDAEAVAVTAMRVTTLDRRVNISWQSVQHSQGVVFEYLVLLQLSQSSVPMTAQLVNCTDCRRTRDQLSPEGRSGLESLTRNWPDVIGGASFHFQDSQMSVQFPESTVSSFQLMQPWTLYTVSVWPLNRAGPGVISSSGFRSQEAPSEMVSNLRVTAESQETAMVEFVEPERKNGLLMAYAIHAFIGSSYPVCSQLVVLNSTIESCQLDSCKTNQLITKLASECDNRVTHLSSESDSQLMKARLQHLQPQTNYTVRVTPVSQTFLGATVDHAFILEAITEPPSNAWVTILVAVVVSVVVLAGVAGLLVFLLVRRRGLQTMHLRTGNLRMTSPSTSMELTMSLRTDTNFRTSMKVAGSQLDPRSCTYWSAEMRQICALITNNYFVCCLVIVFAK